MGYYIQTNADRNKAAYLVANHAGEQLSTPPAKFEDIPQGKALIVVVDNRAFEAAGLIYSAGEFRCFTDPNERRCRQYVLIDKELAHKLAGYSEVTR